MMPGMLGGSNGSSGGGSSGGGSSGGGSSGGGGTTSGRQISPPKGSGVQGWAKADGSAAALSRVKASADVLAQGRQMRRSERRIGTQCINKLT
ncbi:MAG: hypothetical protein CBC50_01585 [Synechococcus sp. TMED90]|nr:MAG: hypothetical protein CBC50_01585 [Synechococcus sp. TMED90]